MKRVLAFFFGLVLTLSIARVGASDSIKGPAHICSPSGKLCMAEVPPITVVVPTGMVCAGKTSTTTSTSTATSTGTLYQTSAQPVTCTVTATNTSTVTATNWSVVKVGAGSNITAAQDATPANIGALAQPSGVCASGTALTSLVTGQTSCAPVLAPGTESARTNLYLYDTFSTTYYLNPAGTSSTLSDAKSVTATPALIATMSYIGGTAGFPDLTTWPAGTYKLRLWAKMASTAASVYYTVTAGSTVIATSPTFTVATGTIAAYDVLAVASTDYTTAAPATDKMLIKLYASSASTNNMTIGYGGTNATFVSAPWGVTIDSTGHAARDLQAPTGGACASGTVVAYLTPGATTCVTNGTGSGLGCSGSCSSGYFSAFTDSTHITNGPMAYSGTDVHITGSGYANGYALCQSNGTNCPATTGMTCGGTCSTGSMAKFSSGSAMTNATAGSDYLAPNGVTVGSYMVVSTSNGLVNGYRAVNSSDVTTAIGYTPLPTSNVSGTTGYVARFTGTNSVGNAAPYSLTPTALNIPIADGSGKLDAWVTHNDGLVNVDSHYATANFGPSPGSCSVVTTNSITTTTTASYLVITASVSAASTVVSAIGRCLIQVDIDGSVPPWGTGAYSTDPWTGSYSYPASSSLNGFYVPSNGGHTISLSICTPSGVSGQCIIQPGSLAGHSASMTTMLYGH